MEQVAEENETMKEVIGHYFFDVMETLKRLDSYTDEQLQTIMDVVDEAKENKEVWIEENFDRLIEAVNEKFFR